MMLKTRLREKFEKEVIPRLVDEFGIKNKLTVPRIIKVVVNSGVGEIVKNKEKFSQAKKDMALITGQAPSVRKARLSVASFSIREGAPVGMKVTLRGDRMYDFLDRLFTIVLPRLRDFRGVSLESFDMHGNYNLGISEVAVFPEIDFSKTGLKGLEISIVTSTNDLKKSRALLKDLGMPFEKKENR